MNLITWRSSVPLFMLLSMLCFGCSTNEFVYTAAQAAETDRCMRESNREDRLACKEGRQSYDDYKKERDSLLKDEQY